MAAGSYSGRAKEAYFDHVFATCYGGKVRAGTWTDPLDRGLGTLDATSREFVARSETDKAIIACTKRWAGWIIEDAPPRDDRSPCALRVTVGGQNVRPLGYDVTIHHERCVRSLHADCMPSRSSQRLNFLSFAPPPPPLLRIVSRRKAPIYTSEPRKCVRRNARSHPDFSRPQTNAGDVS
ncbi:hypothetical protein [uncultured Sphingomonas sp.]|uniref:hypothetical protein n=1 Tax=uncultured Sphingomonas sp. TaxID=158754 RepID=UPI0025EB67E5|nr:hypothetical protein [uncultured Sphingomonas sp.]